ncbi:zf-TFIIB domain-containing protein [Parvibaculum sp.]|uniref:TFIIB-type zinc ribbon-containing protein n=2 Tax=Parvibaculum sp. TaxID=2024848 RepID=UPI000C66CDF6|nr:zf-TFIIB domain-containing protein [Parvibaculum sp.]MAU60084.1 hypothetical protein [Parvibaculum sp.]MBO6669743.1 zf-TFIIB domain-containing protein [Parvibaculum sp.]MBO6693531.1 zf-TFIIB domain-containing protein [Parvibaculum sp.]MBO6716244.1 zf-TFIIB domain-containing protein [Parvibaculum sp.]
MKCPVDNETLVMTDRSGVEIDYCPKCRGVWLDRGELDKIIERSGPAPEVRNAAPREQRPDERYAPQPHYRKKKRESFLSELFDF